MPFSVNARKAALVEAGITMKQIGDETGTDRFFVSHVMAGRYWSSAKAHRVMERIAQLIGAPISEVFPGAERRSGKDRRDPFVEPKVA